MASKKKRGGRKRAAKTDTKKTKQKVAAKASAKKKPKKTTKKAPAGKGKTAAKTACWDAATAFGG